MDKDSNSQTPNLHLNHSALCLSQHTVSWVLMHLMVKCVLYLCNVSFHFEIILDEWKDLRSSRKRAGDVGQW